MNRFYHTKGTQRVMVALDREDAIDLAIQIVQEARDFPGGCIEIKDGKLWLTYEQSAGSHSFDVTDPTRDERPEDAATLAVIHSLRALRDKR